MSFSRITYLYCDGGEECGFNGEPYQNGHGPDNVTLQRTDARTDGWRTCLPGGRDLCPDCAKELTA